MRPTLAAATLALFSLSSPATPSAPSNATSGNTLADFVALSGEGFDQRRFDFDILLRAASTADLVGALANPDADLTLFAPNDLAFFRLARDLGYADRYDETLVWDYLVDALTDLGGGNPIPVLTDILLYHVAPQSLGAIEVLFSSEIATLLDGAVIRPFFFILRDNEPDLRDPNVFVPFNLRASNGILHTISRVLIPLDLP